MVAAADAGLPATAPAFVLRERFSGREWVVGVKLLAPPYTDSAAQVGTRGASAGQSKSVFPFQLIPRSRTILGCEDWKYCYFSLLPERLQQIEPAL